jgi:ferric-dicitrate binding protein FerR (iron transport regulator)
MKNFNSYNDYEIEQWLEDADFIRWIKNPTEESNEFFTALMANDAQRAQKMGAAAYILQGIVKNEPTLSAESKDEMWENIELSTIRRSGTRRSFNYWMKISSIAAGVFLVVGLASYFFFGVNRDLDYKTIAAKMSVDSVSEIRLLMPDKSQITLSNRAEVILGNSGEMTLRSSKGDHVKLNQSEFSEKQFGQLIVPKGKRASMIFADGSRVTVRPGSKVVFPTAFAQKQREIYVQGEAFLEVSKNKKRPFIVKTELMDVQVLGTSFDVSAYPSKNEQSVVLVTGSVKVRSGARSDETRIVPNQRYSYDKTNQLQSVNEVDVFPYISWKDGILSFNSENLGSVLDKLSSYYGVQFDYERNALAEIHLTGKLDLNNDVDGALKVIATISQIQYKHMKKSIKIDVKP